MAKEEFKARKIKNYRTLFRQDKRITSNVIKTYVLEKALQKEDSVVFMAHSHKLYSSQINLKFKEIYDKQVEISEVLKTIYYMEDVETNKMVDSLNTYFNKRIHKF